MITRSRRITILNPTARSLQKIVEMATITIQHNDNPVATVPTLNFNDSSTVNFTVTYGVNKVNVEGEAIGSGGSGSGQIIDCGARIGAGGERIICGMRV